MGFYFNSISGSPTFGVHKFGIAAAHAVYAGRVDMFVSEEGFAGASGKECSRKCLRNWSAPQRNCCRIKCPECREPQDRLKDGIHGV